MKMYVLALAVGILVGIIYGLLDVRSPAPPVVALVGLLGMLIGEQVIPVAKRLVAGHPITTAWVKSDCVPHVFGPLPARPAAQAEARSGEPGDRPT
jgi:XapX domain-containing protein